MKKLFLYFFLALSLASCRKDMEETTITNTVYTPPVIKVNGDIAGLVADENGNGIEGAVVHLGNEQRTTGSDGYFTFKNVVLNANGTYVKVDQPGYFHASKRFFPKANSVNYVTLTLMSKDNSGSVSATAGGSVQLAGGARVSLPANGIVDAAGLAYSGEVMVSMRWLDPSSNDIAATMPGNLQGISKDNKEVVLGTYGMVAVELSGTSGEQLNIAQGSMAELRLPIPAALRAGAPDEIPLWHFDEATGLWREEGSAIKVGNEYVGQVAHFSYWNLDYPFPLVNMTGQLTTSAGIPVTNALVSVSVAGTIQTGYGFTNDTGVFSGKIPANQALVLHVFTLCGELAYESPIGPYTQDVDLGPISLDDALFPTTILSGALLDCNNNPLPEGLVRICIDNSCTFITADAQGNFVKAISYCNSNNQLKVKAYDLEANKESLLLTLAFAPTVDAGNISVCASQITEYIHMNVNGEEFTYLEPDFVGAPGALNRIGSYEQDSAYTIEFTFPVGAVGTYTGNGVRFTYYRNVPSFLAGYCFVPCNSMEVTITQFGNVGEYIQGTFSGTMDFYDSNQQVFTDTPVSGEFSVIRTQ